MRRLSVSPLRRTRGLSLCLPVSFTGLIGLILASSTWRPSGPSEGGHVVAGGRGLGVNERSKIWQADPRSGPGQDSPQGLLRIGGHVINDLAG